ncbi:hypothetical protein PIB30_045673 [Stylosanthes scabra]|uniref:Uncharacterized protein n=1 Tax=Stylosanthes scabra TaxID=79078 RepID=A0ABU6QH18_9FABA|nr:hypothetical protein [Stylosanthes scabra]
MELHDGDGEETLVEDVDGAGRRRLATSEHVSFRPTRIHTASCMRHRANDGAVGGLPTEMERCPSRDSHERSSESVLGQLGFSFLRD